MASACETIATGLRDISFGEPSAFVVSNEDAQAYLDGDGWRDRLPRHVTAPVRFRESLETIASLGATHLVEVGHGSMIAGLAKRTVPDLPVLGIATPDDLEHL
jgi:[acyl-carrier-protein] S-malonyltransferase